MRSSRAISEACKLVGIANGGRAPIEHVAAPFLAQQAALQDPLGQFLDEQRYAVSPIGDLFNNFIGQWLATGDLRYQSCPVAPVQAIKRQHRHLRLTRPGRLELGRNVTISSTRRLRTRATARSSSSREVGSIQCASSKTIITGCWRAKPSSCRISASSVRSFFRCGTEVRQRVALRIWQ